MVKSGCGFETMSLHPYLFRAIKKKGYTLPTPIQRKVIPVALSGQDMIAVARTGSGKTAAFLIPMIQKLKEHSTVVGARGLVISPTRELAMQTLKFAIELCKFSSLKVCVLVGGEGLKNEFSKLAENPDIIIATPGRLMHFILELNYSLASVEMVVLDESDRLIEMGLMEQVQEILSSTTNPNKQTLCFSATLPEFLTQFAKTGLSHPTLVKLDQEYKLPTELKLDFFVIRSEDKDCALMYILKHVVNLESPDELTMIFVSTRHHVEYLEFLLNKGNIKCIGLYGALDQEARNNALDKFRRKHVKLMITTDVSARGLDIPLLDNVIHYDFPSTPKLFIHRSGRAARAGRDGHCYALITNPDIPYYIDTIMHIGNPEIKNIGYFGEAEITQEREDLNQLCLCIDPDELMRKKLSVKNATKLYNKTKESASLESAKRAKEFQYGLHPRFEVNKETDDFTKKLKEFRPAFNIIELNTQNTQGEEAANAIREKRLSLMRKKENNEKSAEVEQIDESEEKELEVMVREGISKHMQLQNSEGTQKKKRGQMTSFKAQDFVQYDGTHFFEKGQDFSQLSLELPMDDEKGLAKKDKNKWDNKKKKYIQDQSSHKKKFEIDGKSRKLYKQWSNQTKKRIQKIGEAEDPENIKKIRGGYKPKADLKSKDQIVKERKNKFKKSGKINHKKVKEEKVGKRMKHRMSVKSQNTRSKMIVKTKRR
ncbi:unnamed protein product [Blepharisma stoltei]|uniref:RNA helicase n=1 Tax=Blepharisma stoltei TaxID=1481888 RepID=A0AAU9JR16_9CILI|nr:unnamed protein product [Blepharisma stoltei]